MRVRAALLVAAAVGGCTQPQPSTPLGYSIVIPDDVPERMALTDKDGVEHEGNGREMYARSHLTGWRQCGELHRGGERNPRDERAVENWVPQCYGVQARGLMDGFKGHQQYLLRQP